MINNSSGMFHNHYFNNDEQPMYTTTTWRDTLNHYYCDRCNSITQSDGKIQRCCNCGKKVKKEEK